MSKLAMVTGASLGIGREISLRLAAEGYDLLICARNRAKLEELQQQLQLLHPAGNVLIYSLDLGKKEEINTLIREIETKGLYIDVLVNNVGLFISGPILEEADETMEEMMHINLFSAYYLSKYCARGMAERKHGTIFGIGSVAGKTPVRGSGSYSVTKFALYGLMANLREELRTSGVRVTSILPGATLTSSWEGTTLPAGQFIQPEDIASAMINCLKMSDGAHVDEITISPLNFLG